MALSRIKFVFHVENADTKEVICEPKQIILSFDPVELERIIEKTKAELPYVTERDLETLVAPLKLTWAREIIQAACTSTMLYVRQAVLKHLGLSEE